MAVFWKTVQFEMDARRSSGIVVFDRCRMEKCLRSKAPVIKPQRPRRKVGLVEVSRVRTGSGGAFVLLRFVRRRDPLPDDPEPYRNRSAVLEWKDPNPSGVRLPRSGSVWN